jgi:23S rRNA (adenine2503-C2)-methyltransferase
MGFTRNLAVHEIACQVRELKLLPDPIRVTNIVFMGMGEPLMNWKAVEHVLTILNDPNGLGIGARHITVSTVGVLPGIVALGERPEQFRLAISIHAPTDELRRELMPINVKYPLSDVIAAAKVFDRRVTFEYVMLHGVNDSDDQARQLANLINRHKLRAKVNLIPHNPAEPLPYQPSSMARVEGFKNILESKGVHAFIRRPRGRDILAACGQLAARSASAGVPAPIA